MRKIALLFLFTGVFFGSGYAQAKKDPKVVLYRTMTDSHSIQFVSNETLITNLVPDSYFVFSADSGRFPIAALDKHETNTSLNLENDKTYYVRYFEPNRGKAQFVLMDSVQAEYQIRLLNIPDIQDSTKWTRPKLRFDLFSSMGFGFESEPLVYLEDGRNSNFSFGESEAVGLGFSYGLTRFLDLSTSVYYSFSHLRPNPINASFDFSTIRWSLTPYLIFPFDQGSRSFKVGVGKDFYFSPLLKIRTAKLEGGFNEDRAYSNAGGYHVALLFDVYDWKYGSYLFGVKVNRVHYLIKPRGYESYGSFLDEPDGTSISFVVGASLDLFRK